MNPSVICKILGIVVLVLALMLIPPALVSLWYEDGELMTFVYAFLIQLTIGLALWLPFYHEKHELRIRDGFLIIALYWLLASGLSAAPFIISLYPSLSLTDAIFEAVSGITTTGATIFSDLQGLPKSILWYRQQLQWFGGMSIIVLAMSLLPILGIGGMHFYRSSSVGQVQESKLTPRIAQTAKALSIIYLSLTLSCALAYWLAGMNAFDAISHSFSTVSIGGFSTHNESLGYFDSPLIEFVAIIFMILSGMNFALHFRFATRKQFQVYYRDSEWKFYMGILAAISIITVVMLYFTDTFNFSDALLRGVFETISFITTTGFTTADYSLWPHFLPYLLLVCAFIGGCVGSTAGGIKMIRILLIYRQGLREIKRLIHPNGIVPIKINKRSVPEDVLRSVWGFFSVYMFMFVLILIALLATGMDQISAWSAVGATINNLGPGLGQVANDYSLISDPAKWILCFSMLLGRVEVFVLLIVLSPEFWRK